MMAWQVHAKKGVQWGRASIIIQFEVETLSRQTQILMIQTFQGN